MKKPIALLIAGAFVAAGPLLAQEGGWLPPQVENGVAQQLADRMQALGDGNAEEVKLLKGAQGLLRAMRGSVETWGAEGTVARAPVFTEFAVPSAEQPHLDAMGRWSICSLVLLLQYESQALDADARLRAALGLSSMTLVILRLREPFVSSGGRQAAIEAHLTSAGFEPVVEAIQIDPKLLAHAAERCEPAIRDLLVAPIQYLREQGKSAR